MPKNIRKLLFIDTNIWLDFYRSNNDASIRLLEHVEAIKDDVIVTYQLESEYKRNRQEVIKSSWANLKAPARIERPNLVGDAKTMDMLAKQIEEAKQRIDKLKDKLEMAIASPSVHDPVYKVCQRIFHRKANIVLTREDPIRHQIRRRAFRRFLHGCPPRKKTDTSIGDAFNWEWMIECAKNQNAELVIVSRDADYGVTLEKKSYINDDLKQEFQERISKKRKVLLYAKLTDALKDFKIRPTKQEVEAEAAMINVTGMQVQVRLGKVEVNTGVEE